MCILRAKYREERDWLKKEKLQMTKTCYLPVSQRFFFFLNIPTVEVISVVVVVKFIATVEIKENISILL